MRDNYFGGSTPRVLDYRNARYQGLLNSSDKRHGFGIVLDDNMNLYCSEWSHGLMDGMTFIYFSNATIFYGHWKQGQPHGLNIFRNKHFTAYIYFYQGSPCRQAMIIDSKLSHLAVIDAEIISRKGQFEPQIISSERIIKAELFEQLLLITSQKIGLLLERYECFPKAYLNKLAAIHSQLVYFSSINDDLQYFGFQNGLGFNFSSSEKKNYIMELISLGHHSKERLTQIGIKYHASGCHEEGNFSNKETISYSKYFARPQDKCQLIYQNVHKKSLNFINQYWDFRVTAKDIIEEFLEKTFKKKFHELKPSIAPQEKKDLNTERQQFYKQAREDYLKAAGQIRNRLVKNKSRPSLSPNKQSKKNASKERQAGQISSQVINHPRKHRECYPKVEPQTNIKEQEEQQIHELVDRLREMRWKKQNNCDKCKQREVARSNKKSKQKKTNKSMSTVSRERKGKDEQPQNRQPKYLKNYPYQQDRSASSIKSKIKTVDSHSPVKRIPSKSGIVKEKTCSRLEEAQRQRSEIRYENQLRIREQLLQEQQKRTMKQITQLEVYQSNCYYGSNMSRQFQYGLPSAGKENISIPSPAISNSKYKVDRSRGYRQIVNPLASIPQLQNLEDRRAKLLMEFKQMNRNLQIGLLAPRYYEDRSMGSIEDYNERSLRHVDTMKTDLILQGDVEEVERDNRKKIEQFNKKYRNLLQQQGLKPAPIPYARLSPKPFLASDEDYRISQYLPDISSFNYLGEQPQRHQKIPSRKTKYQYYF